MSEEFRVIIAGQLQFQNEKVITQVVEQFEHRSENYYKNDILIKAESIFNVEELSMDIPRTVVTSSERRWGNTLNLLQRVVSFSIAGSINLWRLEVGRVIDHQTLEPNNDRTTVQLYNRGRQLVNQKENEQEALKMMTKVVKRFERHAQAYERRGFVNYRLGNHDDALYDYTKSLKINPAMPEAHYGRGLIYDLRKEYALAADDFAAVTKNSIPHQGIYWMAQVALGDTYLKLDQPNDALNVYNMFVKRKQRIGSLDRYDRRVGMALGKLLLRSDRPSDAVNAFAFALSASEDHKAPEEKVIRNLYARALMVAGRQKEADAQIKILGGDYTPDTAEAEASPA